MNEREKISEKELAGLIQQIKKGKEEAFPLFYENTYQHLSFYLSQYTKNVEDIKDILQETYIQAYKNIADLKNDAAIMGWLRTIARNKWVDRARKEKFDFVSYEGNEEILDTEENNSELLPEVKVNADECNRLLRKIIDDLNESQRMVIVEFYYNNRSIKEIATELHVPEGTIKSTLSRTKAIIKDKIVELDKKHGTRIYSISIIPLLVAFFQTEELGYSAPKAIIDIGSEITKNIATGSFTQTGTVPTNGIVAKFTGMALKGKIIACVVAGTAVLVASGTIYAANQNQVEQPVIESQQETSGVVETSQEGEKVTTSVTKEENKELESYVKGIKNWTIEQNAKNVDYMKGVTFDKKQVKAVKADASKVNVTKTGSNELSYTIIGVSNNETVKKTVKVTVVSPAEAKKEADKGTAVVTSNNEVKKDSTGKTPTGVSSSSNSDKATSTPSQSTTKPSEGNSNSGSGNTTPDSNTNSGGSSSNNTNNGNGNNTPSTGGNNNEPTSKPSEPEKPSKPAESHSHSWTANTKTVHHDAVTKVVNHPAETKQVDRGSNQTVVISEAWSEYVPQYEQRVICGYCKADCTSDAAGHTAIHLAEGIAAGYYTENIDVGGQTINHPAVTEQRWVPNMVTETVKEAWSETVVVSEAYDEEVVTGHSCSCGATK